MTLPDNQPIRSGSHALRAVFGATLRMANSWILPATSLLFPARGDTENPFYAPLFLIGVPRTGSTILYQSITQALRVCYVDNLAARFYGSMPFGILLSWMLFGNEPHGSFESLLGRTYMGGLHAPHENGHFWYRWLPHDDHFADDRDIDEHAVRQIRKEIWRTVNFARRPLVIKNLNAGQRLRLIHRVFPRARIIWCRREPAYTIQSILESRTRLDWPENKLWSIRPRAWRQLESLPVIEQVVRQVDELERQIADDLQRFPAEQKRELWYEKWPLETESTLADIARFIAADARKDATLPRLSASGNIVRDQVRFAAILDCISRTGLKRPEKVPIESGDCA